MCIGWDWTTETRWKFTHTEEGIARTLAKLAKYGSPADLPVAVETTRGLVVDRPLQAGHPVVPVHPNAFHAMRPRRGASKARADAGDSLKLADCLRTDGRPEPTGQATMELQALTRQRADHVAARIAAVNRLGVYRLTGNVRWATAHASR